MASNKTEREKAQGRNTSSKTTRQSDNVDEDGSQDGPERQNSTSFSAKSVSNSNKKNQQNDSDNRQDSIEPDELTLQIVKELKRAIDKEKPKDGAVTERYIEKKVVQIKEEISSGTFDERTWAKAIIARVENCPQSLLHRARAYGDDPEQVVDIIKAKMEQKDSTDATSENEDSIETSLEKIIDPLKSLKKEKCPTTRKLFRAVLDMNDDEIDRADRMFYAEARTLLDNPDDYTFENAHDQVQAIRLMHYETEDENDLRRLIKKYRTFNDAYSFLQQLMRQRVTKSSNETRASFSPERDGDEAINRRRKQPGGFVDRNAPVMDDMADNTQSPSASASPQRQSGPSSTPKSQRQGSLVNSSKEKNYN